LIDVTSPDARALVARLEEWVATAGDAGEQSSSTVAEGAYDLEIELFRPGWDGSVAERLAQLDRLRKKVEVARKLYRFYLPDLSLAVGTQVLSGSAVRRLCALMLKAALARHDARFLNSALKLLDGVLGREDCDFPDELRALARATFEVIVPPVPYPA
jgi:hypothetical protein